ncbi:30S ribosome-binding factor RbfA [Bifidobacterium sp. BRDM6]|uniref:Ribosome-binding factor A n=1 Tax=Bifidobacterium choloepi TaxID=2614131 RepID=A0A6I5NE21_9BIFI|nr:30S ribosome-binding factor RbfA [Bifidobacterium choloepi]
MAGNNPRAARIAALIQRVIASNMESTLHDKRLANVTITDVRVTNDLQLAKVYWTVLGHSGHEEGEKKRAEQALNQAKGRLRSLVGRKAGLRLTPDLKFVFDEVPGEAHEIEDILVTARRRDEELRKMRETATYAGDADPYRHDDEDDEGDVDDVDGRSVGRKAAADSLTHVHGGDFSTADPDYEKVGRGSDADVMDRPGIDVDAPEYAEYSGSPAFGAAADGPEPDADVVEVEEFEDIDDADSPVANDSPNTRADAPVDDAYYHPEDTVDEAED